MRSLMRSALRRISSSAPRRCTRRFQKPNAAKIPAALITRHQPSFAAMPCLNRATRYSFRRLLRMGEDRQSPGRETEDGKAQSDNRQSHRNLAPFRNVVGAEGGFHAGDADIQTVCDEAENYHQRAGIQRFWFLGSAREEQD